MHKVHRPKALFSSQSIANCADDYKNYWLAYTKSKKCCCKAATQKLIVPVVAEAARVCCAFMPCVNEAVHAFKHLLTKEKSDHEHNDSNHVVVFKAKLHAKTLIY